VNPPFVVDAFAAEAALAEALERRMRGERFTLRFELLDDATAVASSAIGALIAAHPPGPARRRALDALGARTLKFGGNPQRALTSRPPAQRAAMRELARLAHTIVVHSCWEADDVAAVTQIWRERIRIEPPPVVPVAKPAGRADARAICIYAPGVRPDITALVVHALDDGQWRSRLVVGDALACTGSQATHAADAEGALRSARAIVVVDPSNPGTALSLARLGKPLAVTVTSGAREYLDGVAVYDPWDPRSIREAVAEACEAEAPRIRPRATAAAYPEQPRPAAAPLVSIVVRTHDRPQFLARALASIEAQTYPNIETIVVVDGGAPVDAILAEHPPTQTIVHPAPLGPVPSLIAGMRAANGMYLAILDDDDVLFPDHFERLVGAMIAADGRLVQSIATSLYARAEDDGYRIFGINSFLYRVARPDRIFTQNGAGPMALLTRRDLFDLSGGYDPKIGHAEDWDLLMRLTMHDDMVFLPEVTAAYTIRPEEETSLMRTGGKRMITAMQYMIVKYSLAARPVVERQRLALYDELLHVGGVPHFPDPLPIAGGRLW